MIKNNDSDCEISISDFSIKAEEALVNSCCTDKYEILYFTHGNGKYVVEGIEHSVREHNILVVKPFSYSHVCTQQGHLSGFSISFSYTALSEQTKMLVSQIIQGDEEYSKLYTSFAVPELVFSAFEKLEATDRIPTQARCVYLEALLCEILSLLSISEGEQKEYNEDELGSRVAKYLNRNIDKNISLDKLARRFFVSKYYLCRAFKKYSGTSVHAYINQKRILYAKQLIESGESASAAAYKVGYGDYSAFYRAYKNIVGKSPVRD